MDNWFMREAGSKSRPPFHQDLSYFDFSGTMCVLWLPLEPVTIENGITFVRGSHLCGLAVIPAGTRHGFRNDSDQRVGVLNIFMSGAYEAMMPQIQAMFAHRR